MSAVEIKKNKFTLYGLSKYEEIIDRIIEDLNASKHYFDIKLILTEALTNAFKHGNHNDIKKPIYLTYYYDGQNIKFEVEDSGPGFKDVIIPNEACEQDILNDSGRGLFLIKSLVDTIELRENTLVIEKQLAI